MVASDGWIHRSEERTQRFVAADRIRDVMEIDDGIPLRERRSVRFDA